MKIIFRILIFGLCMTVLSCVKEPASDMKKNTSSIILAPDFIRNIEVKGVSRPDGYENTINNIWVIPFDASGNVLQDNGASMAQYFMGDQITPLEDGKYSIEVLLGSPAEVYFVANTGNPTLFSATSINKDFVKTRSIAIASEGELVPQGTGIIMSGNWVSNGTSVISEIPMKRALAKVTLNLRTGDKVAANKEAFAVQSVQMMNVPNIQYYFRETDELAPGNGIPVYPEINDALVPFDYTAIETEDTPLTTLWPELQWMSSTASGKSGRLVPQSGVTADNFWWYLPENGRGAGTASDQRYKSAEEYMPSGQAGYCTFIRIKGYYKSGELATEVTYDVYLGEDNTSDYNIIRNTNYTVTVTIEGIDRMDTRINADLEDGGFESINYIDYTDNASPWIVVAAENKDQVASTNMTLPEGWRVPTKKDMMLEYVYTAVTNSSAFDGGFFWLNETKSDDPSIRWFIAMGIGEIVLAKEDASYFLRGVKDVSTGFRYPYVQGGKGGSNIIVSRDANGGVREEYVRTSRTTTVNGGEWDWWAQGTPHHTEIQASNIVSAKFEVGTKAIDPDFQRRVTWDDAAEYCSDQGEGWRLPTQRELMLMFVMNDYLEDGLLPSTNDVYPGEGETMNHVFYWSGTEDNSSTDSANTAWSVCFCNGDDVEHSGINGKVEGYMKTGTNYVRCVRDIY